MSYPKLMFDLMENNTKTTNNLEIERKNNENLIQQDKGDCTFQKNPKGVIGNLLTKRGWLKRRIDYKKRNLLFHILV